MTVDDRSRGGSCGSRRPNWSATVLGRDGCARLRRDRSTATSSSPDSTKRRRVRMVGHLDAMLARLAHGRTVAVRAGRVELPPDHPGRRPAGADPPAGDRTGRRGCDGEGLGRSVRRVSSPTSERVRAPLGCRSPTNSHSTARRSGSPTLTRDALDVARANIAGLGRARCQRPRRHTVRGSTRCPTTCTST